MKTSMTLLLLKIKSGECEMNHSSSAEVTVALVVSLSRLRQDRPSTRTSTEKNSGTRSPSRHVWPRGTHSDFEVVVRYLAVRYAKLDQKLTGGLERGRHDDDRYHHETGFARQVAHRVIFMNQGRIVADCPKE